MHSWTSVLAWKLLRNVWGLGRNGKAGKAGKTGRGPIIIQHAHSPDGFFLGLPGAARAVGEEQLALLVNEMLPGASYVLAIGPGWLAETAGALAAHYGCAGQFLVPRMGPGGVAPLPHPHPRSGKRKASESAEDNANLDDSSTPLWRDLDEAAPGAEKRGLGPECESDPVEVSHARSAAHARVLEAIEQAAGDAGDARDNQTG